MVEGEEQGREGGFDDNYRGDNDGDYDEEDDEDEDEDEDEDQVRIKSSYQSTNILHVETTTQPSYGSLCSLIRVACRTILMTPPHRIAPPLP